MFDRLWSNFELVTRPKAERLESLTVDVPLSPRQAFAGGQMRILVSCVRQVLQKRSGGRRWKRSFFWFKLLAEKLCGFCFH
jgi:hypothetical protein